MSQHIGLPWWGWGPVPPGVNNHDVMLDIGARCPWCASSGENLAAAHRTCPCDACVKARRRMAEDELRSVQLTSSQER